MKNLKFTLTGLCLLFSMAYANANSNIYINDPHGWEWGEGDIQEYTLIIEPKGAYLQYELTMSVTADKMMGEADAYEITMNFNLPEGSFINDAYLWVEDSCVQADIMSLWSANQIYETIVNRRRDPLILKKLGYNNEYEMRIYPLNYGSYRQFKISYMVPLNYSSLTASAPLPFESIINTNSTNAQTNIIVLDKDLFGIPNIPELESSFEKKYNKKYGNHYTINPRIKRNVPYHIELNYPIVDGAYLNYFSTGENEGIYQLLVTPSKFIENKNTKKLLVLLDYDQFSTSFDQSDVISTLENILQNNLGDKDSVNIYYSKNGIKKLSDDWIKNSDISANISTLKKSGLSNYSILPEIMLVSLSENSSILNNLNILVISSSDNLGDYKVANSFYNELKNSYTFLPSMHFLNIGNKNMETYRQGGQSYYGNEYLYKILAKGTFGSYNTIKSVNDLSSLFETGITNTGGTIHNVDFYTTLEDGFCYNKYNLHNEAQVYGTNTPIVQIGKYNGQFPFKVELSGFFGTESFSHEFTLKENQIFKGTKANEQILAGNLISSMEKQGSNNEVISSILSNSLQYRILSNYTAFLALEPNMEIPDVDEEEIEDEWMWADIETTHEEIDLHISVGPNPLIENTIIELELDNSENINDYSVSVYNIMGQIVKTFNTNEYQDGNSIHIEWDGTSNDHVLLENGTYLIVVTSGNSRKTVKLVIAR